MRLGYRAVAAKKVAAPVQNLGADGGGEVSTVSPGEAAISANVASLAAKLNVGGGGTRSLVRGKEGGRVLVALTTTVHPLIEVIALRSSNRHGRTEADTATAESLFILAEKK